MRRPKRPAFNEFIKAVRDADDIVSVVAWHPEYIKIDELVETERYYPSDETLEWMARNRAKVPPIVVYPLEGLRARYGIIDGHHRFDAARELSLPGMWAVVIDRVRR